MRLMPSVIISIVAFSLFSRVTPLANAADPADLRVTRVAVFSSGVAYYECEATVKDAATATLSFRTAQINDILKSLIVQDLGGGSVGTVSYASQDPIDKTLRSFGVDITAKPTLGQLLDQLRGEPVEISGAKSLKGVIVGVEKQKLASDKGVVEWDVLNVLTDGGIQQLRVAELGGVRLTNERIDGELRKALATLASGHDADKRVIRIQFDGKGERKVRVAYLLEAPIWKTSYRLALSDDQKPFLQGWATVENATEEDWRDVHLSLVSGRPISFTMDLYSAIYIPRPREELELYASLRPPTYEGGFLAEKSADARPGAPAKAPAAAEGRARAEMKSLARKGESTAEALGVDMDQAPVSAGRLNDAGVDSVATAKDAGELFEYAINVPVSVARQHSAMLPIVNQNVVGEKLSIFNPATHPKHPLHGLRLTNSSGLNLMQGPVTIFDGGVYAGDAKLPDLKPNEKRLVAYALDLGVEVLSERASRPEEVVGLKISRGTLVMKRKLIDDRTYRVRNKDRKDRALLIEQPYSDDWKLIEPQQPLERTAQLSRFSVAAPADKTVSQKVVLERLLDQSIALTDVSSDQILIFLKSKNVSPKVQAALQKVSELRAQLDEASRQRQRAEQELNEATASQARIRENLRTLQAGSDAHRKQEQKFSELEDRIDKLTASLAGFRSAEEQKRQALETYLANLDVE